MKYFLYFLSLSFLMISCESKYEKQQDKQEKQQAEDSIKGTAINNDHCHKGMYIKYAHAYNNYIVEFQGSILNENIRFIQLAKSNDPKDKVEEQYHALEDQTKQAIDSLENLCPFNGNEEFINSALALFKFYKRAWTDYKEVAKGNTRDERLKTLEKVKDRFNNVHSVEEKRLEDNFNRAHTAFANDYMLHVRTTPLHDELDSLMYVRAKR